MNLKPMRSIYTGLLASFVLVLNAIIQFINIYLNDGPEALGFFFFLVTFVMIVFYSIRRGCIQQKLPNHPCQNG